MRHCKSSGTVHLQELGWRIEASDNLGGLLPSIGAIRVGTDWSAEHLRFHGAVGILPADKATSVTAVFYWTHAAMRTHEGQRSLEVTVQWRDPLGNVAFENAVVASQSLVTWAKQPHMSTIGGEWHVTILNGTWILANRSFHVCDGNCVLERGLALQYFRLVPVT